MKVQIFEQFYAGHYTNYIEHLLPTLVSLLDQQRIDQVVVTMTPTHLHSKAFREQLAVYRDRIEFDASLQEIGETLTPFNPRRILQDPTQAVASWERRTLILSNLTQSIRKHQPDYLIATTADTVNLLLAFQATLGRQPLPKPLHSVGLVHYGCSGCVTTWSDQLKDYSYRLTWQQSPWSQLMIVNPLIYESIKSQNKALAQRLSLVPDPVPAAVSFDPKTARELLKIPVEGRYVGFVGGMDHRKAIPELVAAFKAATTQPSDRLLLAGKLIPDYRQQIQAAHSDLLAAGRLILIDRHLTPQEMTAGYCALDVAAILNRRQPTLSANLLKAIAFHKPVIVDDFGYPGFILKHFPVGWTCDLNQPDSIVTAIKVGLERAESYQVATQTLRLIQFHEPTNYANAVLNQLLAQIGQPSAYKTWEWVLHGSAPSV